jgi:pimeloyl-ACP methyl ester carboxylesterase
MLCTCLTCAESLRRPLNNPSNSGKQLGGYNCVDRLHEIKVPCLVVNGRHDTCADFTLAPYFKNLPRVKWVKFESEQSSHVPMWEDRERYMSILDEFLGY